MVARAILPYAVGCPEPGMGRSVAHSAFDVLALRVERPRTAPGHPASSAPGHPASSAPGHPASSAPGAPQREARQRRRRPQGRPRFPAPFGPFVQHTSVSTDDTPTTRPWSDGRSRSTYARAPGCPRTHADILGIHAPVVALSRMGLGEQASRLRSMRMGKMPTLPGRRSFAPIPLPTRLAGLSVPRTPPARWRHVARHARHHGRRRGGLRRRARRARPHLVRPSGAARRRRRSEGRITRVIHDSLRA